MQKIIKGDKTKIAMTAILFLGLFLISVGGSWAIFSYFKKGGSKVNVASQSELESARGKISADLPRTEECPINGEYFTKVEKDIWSARRPITVMIENHADSRPIEGLQKADVVYEAVAEGGITRHMGVFYCGASASDVRVAPVRSARIYFLNWAAEYGIDPIFAHVGGANGICTNCPGGTKPKSQVSLEVRAIEKLIDMGWRVPGGNDFDTTYDSGYPVFYRDPERLGHPIASEHTMVSSTDAMFTEAVKRGFGYKGEDGRAWNSTFKPWLFVDEKPLASPKATKISFEFWDNQADYDVRWEYDQANNRYLRFNGDKPAKDLKSGEQFMAKNVVVIEVAERGPVDSEKHMYYEVIGNGKVTIFQNGDVLKGTWKKADMSSRTKFYDENGKEISLVRGKTWVEAIPSGNSIDY